MKLKSEFDITYKITKKNDMSSSTKKVTSKKKMKIKFIRNLMRSMPFE